MKQFSFVLFSLLLTGMGSTVFAQGISYQAVARNATGQLMANESIEVSFSILEGSAVGTVVYTETHNTTTNPYALFSLVIGKGTSASDFSAIDWGFTDHFLKVEVDGSDMGTTQLETVPYAKVATQMQIAQLTDVSVGAAVVGDVLKYDGTNWIAGTDEVDDADANAGNEIQTLGLTGTNLSLSLGGGNVDLSGLGGGSSVWGTTGSNAFYDAGFVGIGTASPSTPLQLVTDGTISRTFAIDNTNIANGNDLIELRVQTGAPANAAFIEMQQGSTVEAVINTDGSAEFQNVTVEDELDGATAPVKGRLYTNALPIAYGLITFNGGINEEFGIASVTTTTTGVYEITLDNNVVGEPVGIATSYSGSPTDEIVTIDPMTATANKLEVNIANSAGTAVNSAFMIVVYGKVQ